MGQSVSAVRGEITVVGEIISVSVTSLALAGPGVMSPVQGIGGGGVNLKSTKCDECGNPVVL